MTKKKSSNSNTKPVTFEVTEAAELKEQTKPTANNKKAATKTAATPAPAPVATPAPAPVTAPVATPAPVVVAPAAKKDNKKKEEPAATATEPAAAEQQQEQPKKDRKPKAFTPVQVKPVVKMSGNSFISVLGLDEDGPLDKEALNKEKNEKKQQLQQQQQKKKKPSLSSKQIADLKQQKAREEEKLLSTATKKESNTNTTTTKSVQKSQSQQKQSKKQKSGSNWIINLMESLVTPGIPSSVYKIIAACLFGVMTISMLTIFASKLEFKFGYMAILGALVVGLAIALFAFVNEFSGSKSAVAKKGTKKTK